MHEATLRATSCNNRYEANQSKTQLIAATVGAGQSETPSHSTRHLIVFRQRLLQLVARKVA